MCGIAGHFDIEHDPSDAAFGSAIVRRMLASIGHRGPDGIGAFQTERAALGCVRLAIRGVDDGAQPLFNEDETIIVVCNGEVFNYDELAARLTARGHVFRTHSDCEIFVHLYEEYGPEALAEVNGQFALALLDRRRQRLLLARDQFGIAPLFYAWVGGRLVFASEIKALLEFPGVERTLDLTGLDQFLALPGVVSPRTLFRDVHAVPPGHLMVQQVAAERASSRCYWDIEFSPESELVATSEPLALEELGDALGRAVSRRLVGEVPLGVYLSGGLDSSLVAALVRASIPGGRLQTFSADVVGCYSEKSHQDLVAAALEATHTSTRVTTEDVATALETIVWHAETPLKESIDVATLRLSQLAASAGVKAVLTGQGADELFAGYVGYRFDTAALGRGAVRRSPDPEEAAIRTRLWGDADCAFEGHYAQARRQRHALYRKEIAARHPEFDALNFAVVDPARISGLHPLQQRSYLDLKLRLADHLLADLSDRMGYANSVESRHPFLDLEVVRSAARLPARLKVRDFEEKYALRVIARPHVPEPILGREKFGLTVPSSVELLHSQRDVVETFLSRDVVERVGVFDVAAIDAMKRRYLEPDFSITPPFEHDDLFVLLTFHVFAERFGVRV
jgi:asparagine synthase (glutamine-hydrolysing)